LHLEIGQSNTTDRLWVRKISKPLACQKSDSAKLPVECSGVIIRFRGFLEPNRLRFTLQNAGLKAFPFLFQVNWPNIHRYRVLKKIQIEHSWLANRSTHQEVTKAPGWQSTWHQTARDWCHCTTPLKSHEVTNTNARERR
jgi:hypothetical protein